MIKTVCLLFLFAFTSSCLVNPHDKEEFGNFYFESIDLTENLVFYHFNETNYTGAAGDIVDSSGLGKNSTSIGNLTKQQGIYGEGIHCDGVETTGVQLDPSEFDNAFTERTISVWFRANVTTDVRYIYEEGGTVNGINIYIQDGLLYGGTYKNTGADYDIFISNPVEIDRWYHVAITYNAISGFYLYIDGEIAAGPENIGGYTFPSHGDPNGLCFQNGGTRRHTGSSGGASSGQHVFDGVLDELAIWNRTLGPAEIKAVYNRQGRI